MTTLINHSDAKTLDHASEPGACDLCRSLMRGDLDGENIDVRNHHACSPCSDDILKREAEGRATCTFDDGAWTWHPSTSDAHDQTDCTDFGPFDPSHVRSVL